MPDNAPSDDTSTSSPATNDTGTPSTENQTSPPVPELPSWATRPASTSPFSESRFAAYIGPKWESTYRAKLAPFFADPSFTPTWNWAAAFGTPLWFLYRKLYLAFTAFLIAPGIVSLFLIRNPPTVTLENVASPEVREAALASLSLVIATGIAAGGTANWFLFRRARAAAAVVAARRLPEDDSISLLRRIGGVSWRTVIAFTVAWLVLNMAAALAPTN